jgi:hypothetical protein
MCGLLLANKWDELMWRAYPEFEHSVDFVNHTKGWYGYARFSGRRTDF